MEAQMTSDAVVQTPAADATAPVAKKSLLKRIPKWAIYGTGAVVLAAVLGFGYTQHWFKFAKLGPAEKANEVVSAVAPAPEAAPAAQTAVTAEEVLAKARQAFATGDVQGAINGYRELLAKNPNDLGAMGELGNVFYTTGWIPQATQTFFETANLAIAQNRPDVAEALLPVIIESNPMLAGELQDRLFDVQMQQESLAPEQRG